MIMDDLMVDLISRKEAIDAFTGMPPDFYHTSYIVSTINSLASMDAVVHGRWIYRDDDYYPWLECSVCNWEYSGVKRYRYCPNCGAKMDDAKMSDD
jgi:rubredoxin